jgi:hypothetical protein
VGADAQFHDCLGSGFAPATMSDWDHTSQAKHLTFFAQEIRSSETE